MLKLLQRKTERGFYLMKLKYDFIIQKVGDTQVAVPAGDDANRFSGIIKLNTTGAVIFEMLKKIWNYAGGGGRVYRKIFKFAY